MWGVITLHEDDSIHIVPVDDEGEVKYPHVLNMSCSCHPAVADWRGIIHEEIQ